MIREQHYVIFLISLQRALFIKDRIVCRNVIGNSRNGIMGTSLVNIHPSLKENNKQDVCIRKQQNCFIVSQILLM